MAVAQEEGDQESGSAEGKGEMKMGGREEGGE